MSGTVSITWEPRLRAHRARCVCGWHITDTDLFAAVMEMERHQEVCGSDGR